MAGFKWYGVVKSNESVASIEGIVGLTAGFG
jgi:hypothetical protein